MEVGRRKQAREEGKTMSRGEGMNITGNKQESIRVKLTPPN